MVRKSSSSSIPRDDSPCFYKVIFNPHVEELRIPSEFVKYITKEATETTILKGPSGKYWNMKLREDEEGLFFNAGGWNKFAREQQLEEGDFLLFQYDGKITFHVRIFNKNGLER
ncbi:B3 domain-containing protein Os01g0723500-like [Nicotiana tabacum]|uniref:B3 domain-containing protein Os01g0723500-like n=2 Tax=Nicotiana TaxID=4085 RepID=A0AC58RQ61_TOBAC|nr:PREDICTED: B3 domain-containing protein Os01g0723500-like [Nicotiana sylvestris]